ncbi:MAG: hypothetical protein ACM3QZ_04715 [Solirubrobacterales bacterium]
MNRIEHDMKRTYTRLSGAITSLMVKAVISEAEMGVLLDLLDQAMAGSNPELFEAFDLYFSAPESSSDAEMNDILKATLSFANMNDPLQVDDFIGMLRDFAAEKARQPVE